MKNIFIIYVQLFHVGVKEEHMYIYMIKKFAIEYAHIVLT